jgi:hypothetical protein
VEITPSGQWRASQIEARGARGRFCDPRVQPAHGRCPPPRRMTGIRVGIEAPSSWGIRWHRPPGGSISGAAEMWSKERIQKRLHLGCNRFAARSAHSRRRIGSGILEMRGCVTVPILTFPAVNLHLKCETCSEASQKSSSARGSRLPALSEQVAGSRSRRRLWTSRDDNHRQSLSRLPEIRRPGGLEPGANHGGR